ncbi:MAG: hypothetical protein ACK42D_01995 [Candidatus Paceibacteria bacterium]
MSQPVIEPNFEGEEMKIPEGMAQPETPAVPTKSILSTTALILLVLTLLAVFAGLGYWYHLVMNAPITDMMPEESTALDMNVASDGDASAEAMIEVSSSDEIEAIEADIENTDLSDLDRELAEIDAAFEAEMGAEIETQ